MLNKYFSLFFKKHDSIGCKESEQTGNNLHQDDFSIAIACK